MLQIQGYKMYLCWTFFWNYLPWKFFFFLIKCYKLKATKYTFVELSSGIISHWNFCKMLYSGLQNVPLLNFLLELSPLEVFVKCNKLGATKCPLVELSSGIISPVSFCKMLQTQGYKMYLCWTFFWDYLLWKF
jgi:hypothetical protein